MSATQNESAAKTSCTRKGKTLPERFCLAENQAISCGEGERTMRPFAEHIARVISERDDIEVSGWSTEEDIRVTVDSKEATFDFLILTEEGIFIDLEAQKSNEEELAKRKLTYVVDLMMRQLLNGVPYESLKDVYIVFVCQDDLLETGLAVDEIELRHITSGAPLLNSIIHLCVLCEKNNINPTTPKEILCHDFYCDTPSEIIAREMRERLNYLQSEEGRYMIIETDLERRERIERESREKGRREGIEEGRKEANEAVALILLRMGKLSREDISQTTGLSLFEIDELAKTLDPKDS